MPRKLRLEFSGACYHVINRGNYRRDLFTTDGAASSFYGCLDDACTSFGWMAHAFSIMGTHFHLGADREAVRLARTELWEDQLRALATAFGIPLDNLPRKKSAAEKLILATALKQTTSVSREWLAQRLQMGNSDSISSLLHRFRATGATERAQYKEILSGFRA
jgi:hypothetical protein